MTLEIYIATIYDIENMTLQANWLVDALFNIVERHFLNVS
jgi:hypothetical protein